MYICLFIFIYIYIYIYIYTYTYIYRERDTYNTHTYLYIYIYVYTHTHLSTGPMHKRNQTNHFQPLLVARIKVRIALAVGDLSLLLPNLCVMNFRSFLFVPINSRTCLTSKRFAGTIRRRYTAQQPGTKEPSWSCG